MIRLHPCTHFAGSMALSPVGNDSLTLVHKQNVSRLPGCFSARDENQFPSENIAKKNCLATNYSYSCVLSLQSMGSPTACFNCDIPRRILAPASNPFCTCQRLVAVSVPSPQFQIPLLQCQLLSPRLLPLFLSCLQKNLGEINSWQSKGEMGSIRI